MQSLKDLYYWKGLFSVFVKHYYELKVKNEKLALRVALGVNI